MLIVYSQLQLLLTVCVQRQQIEITFGAPVQHAAAAIHGGIDECVSDSAILGLNVDQLSPHRDIGIVTKQHADVPSTADATSRAFGNSSAPH
jgi:anthranilate/para-aminobenzoate synthase component II